MSDTLTPDLAERFARIALGHVEREYPNKPDETVAELPLAEPIAPGATVEVAIQFTEQLPEVFARTGYKGEFHMVGQWFPKIGVRTGPPGAEQWECQPLHINTEFFADFGMYDVTLTVPNTEVVATTGVGGPDVEEGEPPGTVYVAVLVRGHTTCVRLDLSGDPSDVLRQTRSRALELLRDAMRAPADDVSAPPRPGTARAGGPAGSPSPATSR